MQLSFPAVSFQCSLEFHRTPSCRVPLSSGAVNEVVGVAPVEGGFRMGSESSGGGPPGTSRVPAGATGDETVQGVAVCPYGISYVGNVFQPAFYLE